MKKLILIAATLLLSVMAMAQDGGIKASVVSRAGRAPIYGAVVELRQGVNSLGAVTTKEDGNFLFENLADGSYTLVVNADEYTGTQVNVIVEKGLIRDLMFVTLTPSQAVKDAELDASSFAEFDLDDSGYSDAPTILFGSNDVFSNVAGYGFSSVRFKNRGYNSESQEVYLAGVPMNDAITGYTPFSLWSGLNEAMRSKESSIGLESADYGFGGYNGITNISAEPSAVRPGWRFSVLSNSALYRLRLMATYASGENDKGWSYAVNASARLGGNDWVEGVYYRSFAIYAGVGKRFNDEHKLSLMAFATPGQRGAQNASTQEVYDLMGDNMYNSNWGYQNGKVRNSRVRRTFEPIAVLKYDYTPSDVFKLSATILYRTGYNGYSALDWYDAQDPRPDYYKNLPSYAYIEDEDYNRVNEEKAQWLHYAWTNRSEAFRNYQHLNWDRLYNVNYSNPDGRSKYALEERHVDQNDLNLAVNTQWLVDKNFTLRAGASFKINRTEHYKTMKDLLGGQYYLNIDSFAERDFASNLALVQNDLDYFFKNGEAEKISRGGKYGYDYYAHVRNANIWASGTVDLGAFKMHLALKGGYERFWREGLVRKGLFAGLDDDGNEIIYNGQLLTSYDTVDGERRAITSKGNSDKLGFFTYSEKLGLEYQFTGGHRIYANAAIISDAPNFNQSFISPRTRNSIVKNLENMETYSTDLSYQYSNNGYNLRLTAYWTKINNQTDMMSFYDDSQHSFTNFSMTGIDQRHMGLEFGVQVPLFVKGLTASAVVSWGEYIYTSTPRMLQTIDNSAEIIRNEEVPYWKSSPIFKTLTDENGNKIYDVDAHGNYRFAGEKKHYVPSTPQLATQLSLNYRTNSYWFFELNGQYFDNAYLDMNPLFRTAFAVGGGDGIATPEEIDYMTSQEKFDAAFLLNCSVGKSWYIDRKYNIGFSLEVKNMLNNRNVKTGGYEQTRLISSQGKDRYYRFDSKYFYMQGANYMLNIYFRF